MKYYNDKLLSQSEYSLCYNVLTESILNYNSFGTFFEIAIQITVILGTVKIFLCNTNLQCFLSIKQKRYIWTSRDMLCVYTELCY